MPKKKTATKKDDKPKKPKESAETKRLRKLIRAEVASILFSMYKKRKSWMS